MVLAAFATVLWPAGPATAAPAPPPLGLQSWTHPSAEELHSMARAGVRNYRAVMLWSRVEPAAGRRDWAALDALVADAASARIRVLGVLLGSPPFAAAKPEDPPATPAGERAFARFARDAVGRYGRGGTFWELWPSLPYRPVTHWQVWNEPNLEAFSGGRPSARAYARLLRRAARQIRAVDGRARVVLAGMPVAAVPVWSFVRRLYRLPGARRDFDVVAVHPYAHNRRGVVDTLRRVRAVVDRAGDARTPIWVTEVGWATAGGALDPAGLWTTERGQARRLDGTLAALSHRARRLLLRRVFWFSWRDFDPRPGEGAWWARYTGLVRSDGSPKPAWRTFARWSARAAPR